MVFSSYLFLFYFLPVALVLYYASPRRAQHAMLTGLSYVFYGWANPLFVVLMFASTLADYVSGLVISGQHPAFGDAESIALEPGGPRGRLQKTALAATIILNLCLLGFFKYFNFGIDSYNALVAGLGLDRARWEPFFRVTLPLLGPGLTATGVFAFIQAWNEFTFALVIMNRPDTRTLPVWLTAFVQATQATDWAAIMAGSTLMAIPVIIFFLLVQGRMASGVAAGAVKG